MTSLGQRLRAKLVPCRATVTSRTDPAGSLVELTCTAPTTFETGQVLAVRVDGKGSGPTGTWRRYTIAEATGDTFRLLLQRNPAGAAAQLIDTISTGDHMTIRGPASAVLPSAGDGPLLIVADLTGLATIAALVHGTRGHDPTRQISIAVFSTDTDIDSSVIARVVGTTAGDVTVHSRHEHIAAWVRDRPEDDGEECRLLGIGEQDLTRIAQRAALASAIAPSRIRTRTYWRPGRRGLE